jgi:hypothetical protein
MQFQKSKFLSAIWHGLLRTAPYWGILAALLVLIAWLLKDRVSDRLVAARSSKAALLSRQQAFEHIRDLDLSVQQLWRDLTNIAVRVEDTHRVAGWILLAVMGKSQTAGESKYYEMIGPDLIRLERHQSSRRLLVLALRQTEQTYDLTLALVEQPQFHEEVGQALESLRAALQSFDDATQRFEQAVREITGTWPVEPKSIKGEHVGRIRVAVEQYKREVSDVMSGAMSAINANFGHLQRLYNLVEYEVLTIERSSNSWTDRLFWISLFASFIAIVGKWLEIQVKKKRQKESSEQPV